MQAMLQLSINIAVDAIAWEYVLGITKTDLYLTEEDKHIEYDVRMYNHGILTLMTNAIKISLHLR